MFDFEYYYSHGEWVRSGDHFGPWPTFQAAVEYFQEYYTRNLRSRSNLKYRIVNRETGVVWATFPANSIIPDLTFQTPQEDPDLTFPTQDTNMPTPAPTPLPAPLPATDVAAHKPLVEVAVKRGKPDSRLVLTINAKELHSRLDEMGAPSDGDRYSDGPASTFRIVNGDSLSTELFLKKEYPVTVNLTGIFSQPPTPERLKAICNSTYDVVRKILLHYQPIDIKVTLLKRPV